MSTIQISHVDLELSYGNNENDHEGSSCLHFYSVAGGSFDDARFSVYVSDKSSRSSTVSECSVEEVEIKVHSCEDEKVCRICHLSLDGNECGVAIELGCSCKDDLAVAHKHCAEAWFKIKGNKTCEICNAVARNIVGGNEAETPREPSNNEDNHDSVIETEPPAAAMTPISPRPRRCWNGHRFLNFLLACMVFAFVISWLFHFNVPS